MDAISIERLLEFAGRAPTAEARLVLERVIAPPGAFLSLYDLADRLGRAAPISAAHACAARLRRLRADGFVRWPYAFPLALCRRAAKEVLSALAKGRRLIGREAGAAMLRGGPGLSFQLSRSQHGFSRVFWSDPAQAPESVRRFVLDPRLAQLVSAYYNGAPVRCEKAMGEELVPAPIEDRWHMDSITDQFKVMVLLTDVGARNGPMRYLTGTQRRPADLDRRYERVLSQGYAAEAYPPEAEVGPLLRRLRRGTGCPGDALLFDTVGVHSGSRCLKGRRLIVTVYFSAATPKNRLLFALRRPHDI